MFYFVLFPFRHADLKDIVIILDILVDGLLLRL